MNGALKFRSQPEVLNFLQQDHDLIQRELRVIQNREQSSQQRRKAAESLVPLLNAHTLAEEEVILSRALDVDELKPQALKMLEEHEIVENQMLRLWQSADEEQFAARSEVLCDLIQRHFAQDESVMFPGYKMYFSETELEEMSMRYIEVKQRNDLAPVLPMPVRTSLVQDQSGKIGYIFAWLLGVPAWLLLMIFLIRGH